MPAGWDLPHACCRHASCASDAHPQQAGAGKPTSDACLLRVPVSPLTAATYTGYAWRLCDETTGMALAEYVGASAIITLQKDGRVRVASTAAATLDGFSAPTAAAAEGEEEEEEGGEEDSEQE